jgi:hypothetical protein
MPAARWLERKRPRIFHSAYFCWLCREIVAPVVVKDFRVVESYFETLNGASTRIAMIAKSRLASHCWTSSTVVNIYLHLNYPGSRSEISTWTWVGWKFSCPFHRAKSYHCPWLVQCLHKYIVQQITRNISNILIIKRFKRRRKNGANLIIVMRTKREQKYQEICHWLSNSQLRMLKKYIWKTDEKCFSRRAL